MSIKTTLTNLPTIALQIIGVLLILASIVGFGSSGMLWPMLGSAVGTWLVILGWERTREKLAALQKDHLWSNRKTAESRDRPQLDLFAGGNEIRREYPPGVCCTLHFDIAAMVQHLNILDTPENRAALEEELRATIEEKFPKEKPEASRRWA